MRWRRQIVVIFAVSLLFLTVYSLVVAISGLATSFENRITDAHVANVFIPRGKLGEKLVQRSVLIGYANADKLTIFSAFSFDDRISVIISSYGFFERRVYCRLFDGNGNELSSEASSVFPEFIVKCSPNPAAKFVALSINSDDQLNANEKAALIAAKSDKPSAPFAVCLAPIFGPQPKWLELVEFVEFYKLQGAAHFLVYVHDVNNLTGEILSKYAQGNEEFEVIPIGNQTKCLERHRCRHEMQLQVCNLDTAHIFLTSALNQDHVAYDFFFAACGAYSTQEDLPGRPIERRPVLPDNAGLDCVHRSRDRFQWVATVDLDERIMLLDPQTTIADFLRKYDVRRRGEHRFRCMWTLRYEGTPEGFVPSVDDVLPMLRWHNTSRVAPFNHTTKSIVKPNAVESMGVHGVQQFAKGFDVHLVSPEVAVVRHYRLSTNWSYFLSEVETFGNFTHFSPTPQFSHQLLAAVNKFLKRFQTDHEY